MRPLTTFLAFTSVSLGALSGAVALTSCRAVLDISDPEFRTEAGASNNQDGGSVCPSGRATCGGDKPCEVDIATDVNNCGACGAKCNGANGKAKCVAGACAVESCNAGFDNCDKVDSNGCETELATSGQHCGRCAHACAGGQCSAGVCQLVPFVDTDGDVREIRLGDNVLHVLSDWSLSAYALDTGKRIQRLSPPDNYVGSFAVSGTNLVVGNAFAVTDGGAAGTDVVSIDGAGVATCLIGGRPVVATARVGTSVYFAQHTAGNDGQLLEALAGSTCAAPQQKVLAGNLPRAVALAVDLDSVYYATATGIVRGFRDGTPSVNLVAGASGIRAIAVDNATDPNRPTSIFWADATAVRSIAKSKACANLAGGCDSVVTVAPTATGPIAVDDKYAYVGTGSPDKGGYRVAIFDKGSSNPAGQIASPQPVVSVVTDATTVYFAAGKRVFRVSK
jgi:hypothetical protein